MPIDARVARVDLNQNGSGHLYLESRPPDSMGPGGGPGQNILRFIQAPRKVHSLEGKNVWGGTGEIMLGTRKIATRAGYEMLVFVEDHQFEAALAAYWWTTQPESR